MPSTDLLIFLDTVLKVMSSVCLDGRNRRGEVEGRRWREVGVNREAAVKGREEGEVEKWWGRRDGRMGGGRGGGVEGKEGGREQRGGRERWG